MVPFETFLSYNDRVSENPGRLLNLSYAYMFLFSLRFGEVFWILFLRSKGLSFAAIGILETVFHVTSLLGEVPTGIMADRYGRKWSLAAGRLLAALSACLMLMSKEAWMLAGAFALNALSYAFHSGAYEALLYDALPPEKRPEFTRILGRANSVYLAGTSSMTLLAGILGQRSLEILYIISVAVDSVCFGVALLMDEGDTHVSTDAAGSTDPVGHVGGGRPQDRRGTRGSESTDVRTPKTGLLKDLDGLAKTLKRAELRYLLLLWAAVSALVTSVKFYGQSFLRDSMIPLFGIAAANTIGNLMAVAPARNAYKAERRFGQTRALAAGSFLTPVIVILMVVIPSGASPTGLTRAIPLVFYLGLIILNETLYPIFSNAVNSMVRSSNRAAVLSSGNMLFSILMMIVFPAMGLLADRVGLQAGMVLVAAGVELGVLIIVFRGFRNGNQGNRPRARVSNEADRNRSSTSGDFVV